MYRRAWRAALLVAALSTWPLTGQAKDYLASAREALHRGDLKTAEIELRNAVRADPQDPEARLSLAGVELQLADPVAAERDARAAELRGADRHKTLPLIAQAMLSQGQADRLLRELAVTGKDPALDAVTLAARGDAQIAIGRLDEAAQSYAQAEKLQPTLSAAWLADARLAVMRGDLAGAETKVDRALEQQAGSVDARVLKAQVLRAKGDAAGALALLDKIIADSPSVLQARLERAAIRMSTGDLDQADADLTAVLKALPGDPHALYLKAIWLHEKRDDHAADAILAKLSSVLAQFPRGYLLNAAVKEALGQLQLAAESAAKFNAREPNDLGGVKILASIDLRLGRPANAVEPLKRIVERGKPDAQVFALLGRAYSGMGQSAQAANALQKALELEPGNIAVMTQLAAADLQSGRADAAMAALERALDAAPKNGSVAQDLYLAGVATGDLNKAGEALDKIRAAQGDTVVTENLEGSLKLARLDLDGARATFASVVQRHPEFVPAAVNLARVLSMQGKNEDAEKVLRGLLDKDPNAEPALGLMTAGLLRTGRPQDAIALMERAHEAAPKNPALIAALGDVYIRAGSPQRALDLVAGAQPGAPGAPALMAVKALAETALKQPDKARETMTRLLEAEPQAVNVRRQLAGLLTEAGDYQAARDLIKAGMRLSPGDYQLRLDYALIDLKAGGTKAAAATAETLHKEDLSFKPGAALVGDVYIAAGQPEDAAKAYREAAAAAPSTFLTLRLAAALQRAGQRPGAEAVLADWLADHPDDLAAANLLAQLEIEAHEYDRAVKNLQAVLAQRPREPASLNNLAWVYQLQGNEKEARSLAEQAYLLAPTPQTADTLGWILTREGDAGKGLPLLRQASGGANDPRIAYHLAVALKDTGQRDESIQLLKAVTGAQGEFDEKAEAQRLLSEMTKGS